MRLEARTVTPRERALQILGHELHELPTRQPLSPAHTLVLLDRRLTFDRARCKSTPDSSPTAPERYRPPPSTSPPRREARSRGAAAPEGGQSRRRSLPLLRGEDVCHGSTGDDQCPSARKRSGSTDGPSKGEARSGLAHRSRARDVRDDPVNPGLERRAPLKPIEPAQDAEPRLLDDLVREGLRSRTGARNGAPGRVRLHEIHERRLVTAPKRGDECGLVAHRSQGPDATPPGGAVATRTRYGVASRIRLKGVSVARRTR